MYLELLKMCLTRYLFPDACACSRHAVACSAPRTDRSPTRLERAAWRWLGRSTSILKPALGGPISRARRLAWRRRHPDARDSQSPW